MTDPNDIPRWAVWLCAVPLLAFILGTAVPLAGWAVSTLWGWFLTPLGLPAITWVHGAGIDALIGFMAYPGRVAAHPDVSTSARLSNHLVNLYVRPLVALGVGWVLVQLMGGAS